MAFIINDESTQPEKLGLSAKDAFGATVAPMHASISTRMDATAKLTFKMKMQNYQIYTACTVQVIQVLEKIFPTLTIKQSQLSMYLLTFTVQLVITYVEMHYGNAGRKQKAAML